MTTAALLRSRAEREADAFPGLMASADHLASAVLLGMHGRRRAGMGDEFWQHRPAMPGDTARQIDWRRSARSDAQFVQEKEWQAAQSVLIWVDRARSMDFASDARLPAKGARARLLGLAAAILLNRGGERVALAEPGAHPRHGEAQLHRIARSLAAREDALEDGIEGVREYGLPDTAGLPAHARGLFLSDFLGDLDALEAALGAAADRGIRGAMVQILDPQEEAFPFQGRTVFESMGRSLRHETLKAGDLRDRYLDRLAARKAALQALAQDTGWQFHCHHTDQPASAALLWIFGALEHRRGC